MLSLSVWALLHFVLAAGLTLLARRYALRRRLLDQPGERRSHAVATPRGGGISIVVATFIASAVLAMRWPAQAPLLGCFALGLVLVAAIGWIDDHRPLSPWLRLAVQAVAGAVLGWGTYNANGGLIPAVLAVGLVLVLVNVWNFMDGIDGLAASQAILAAIGFAWVLGAGPWGLLAVGFASAAAGFLPFNFPRARIFLGDVGSGAIGYTLATLALATGLHRPDNWVVVALPLAAFLVDSAFTLVMRIIRREQWWAAHVQHAYQVAARRVGHFPVTLAYGLFSLGAGLSMVWAIGLRPSGTTWVLSAWFGLAACVWAAHRWTNYD